jgi:hypothetical protein
VRAARRLVRTARVGVVKGRRAEWTRSARVESRVHGKRTAKRRVPRPKASGLGRSGWPRSGEHGSWSGRRRPVAPPRAASCSHGVMTVTLLNLSQFHGRRNKRRRERKMFLLRSVIRRPHRTHLPLRAIHGLPPPVGKGQLSVPTSNAAISLRSAVVGILRAAAVRGCGAGPSRWKNRDGGHGRLASPLCLTKAETILEGRALSEAQWQLKV